MISHSDLRLSKPPNVLAAPRGSAMTHRLDPGMARKFGQFVAISSLFSIAVGLAGLAGWVFHVPILKSVLPGLVTMKANTAACVVLIGVSLWWLRAPDRPRPFSNLMANGAAAVVSAVGLLSFLEFLGGWNFGIDQFFFVEAAEEAIGSVRPGLMSPITALAFLLLGLALLLLDWTRWREASPAQSLALGSGLISLFALLDFIVQPHAFHTHIALPTVITLCLLSLGIVCSRPERGFVGMLLSANFRSGTVRGLWAAALSEDESAWRQPLRYGLAVLLVFLATVLRYIPGGFLPERLSYITYYPATVIVAIVGSLGPGILATLLSDVCVDYFFLQPQGQFGNKNLPDVVGLILFTSIGIGVSWLAGAVDRTRKRVEEETREASRYARSLLEASLDPLVTISREGKITDLNEATEKVTGASRKQLVGSDFSDYFTDPEKARQGYQQVFAQETVRDYPLAIRHTSGRVMEVLYNASVFKNGSGEVDGVFAAARDVTERKRAEEELRKASLYARSLLEASLDPLVTISREGKITDVNEATEKVTGVSRERLIGSDFSSYFTQPEKARQGYEQVFASGSVQDYPLAIRHISRKVTDVLYNATVFKNEVGEIEGVFAAARDVTERNRAEQALNRSEIRYRSLVTATTQIVWTTDPQGEVVDDMPTWRAFTGMSVEQIQGWGWVDSLHPDDRKRATEIWSKAVRERSVYETEYRMRRRDGEYRMCAVRGVPVQESDGSIREWVGTCTDITERKHAEEEVRRLNAELEERVIRRTAQLEAANKELEAFTYSVSHDLRAPLRHISGFSKILTEEFGSSLPAEAQYHLQRIQEGTRRMGLLVDDLLNLGRIGRHEVRLQVTGLNSLVNEVVAELKAECKDRQIEWKIGNLPFVECDPGLIKQIFQNLLSNAVKFTRPRTPAIIEVGQKDHEGAPAVFVRDNGVGFNMKYADKLFGVFQRLHRPEDFEGTGVGLATVQRIIQKHGGRIWAEAELDKGATFYFTLGNSEKTELKAKTAAMGDQA
jgi:PAS domain S-box-containing protein